MARYIFFLCGGYEAYAHYTPAQVDQAIQKYRNWAGQLASQGKLVSAEKIKDGDRRILRGHNGDVVLQSGLPETDDTVGGLFIIEAADWDEAIQIGRACPIFAEGGSVELRELE